MERDSHYAVQTRIGKNINGLTAKTTGGITNRERRQRPDHNEKKERYANFFITIATNYSPPPALADDFEMDFRDKLYDMFQDRLYQLFRFPNNPEAEYSATYIKAGSLQSHFSVETSSKKQGKRTHAHVLLEVTHYTDKLILDIPMLTSMIQELPEVKLPYIQVDFLKGGERSVLQYIRKNMAGPTEDDLNNTWRKIQQRKKVE